MSDLPKYDGPRLAEIQGWVYQGPKAPWWALTSAFTGMACLLYGSRYYESRHEYDGLYRWFIEHHALIGLVPFLFGAVVIMYLAYFAPDVQPED